MSSYLWYSTFHIGSVITLLLTLLFTSKVLRSSRMPAVTFGWLSLIIFIPLLGIPLYLAFGERKINIRLNTKKKIFLHSKKENIQAVVIHPIHSLLTSLGLPASSNNQSQFHEDGKASWLALVNLLEDAQKSIDITIFILGNDQVGQQIVSILTKKAAQGIKVRVLLDGVGSFLLPKKSFLPLIKKGGKVAWFIPVIHRPFRGRTNLRSHRKIVIADKNHVWSGGRNLSDDYLGSDCSNNCWVDMSFNQKGPIVSSYQEIFEADWGFATHAKPLTVNNSINSIQVSDNNSSDLQLIPSGPDVRDDPIYSVILTACYAAKSHIMITTPYYVPDENIQKALSLAALRGINVDLILPRKSNYKLADIARNRSLRQLSQDGVNIWYFPTMIHAKVMIVDDNFAMVGSANLDIRSLFFNCELMSAFYSKKDILWLMDWFKSLCDTCHSYQAKPVSAITELIEGLVLLGAYQL